MISFSDFFYVVNKTLNTHMVSCSKLSSFRMIDVFCFNSDKSFLDGIKKENNNEKCFFMFNKIFFMWWIGHLVSCLQWVTFYKTKCHKNWFHIPKRNYKSIHKIQKHVLKISFIQINIFSVLGVHVHNIHLPVGEKFTRTLKQKTRSINLVSRLSF